MSDISSELQRELSARAEAHYSNALPYHNWEHAIDMMDTVADLADRSINADIRNKRNLLMVTAAWHDADYAVEDLEGYASKEERSAYLAVRSLPELSDEDSSLVFSGIIDTTVHKVPKSNLFGEVTHAADVGYFAADYTRFMGRLTLMRAEWGSPSWGATVERTLSFGRVVIEEASQYMPQILSSTDSDAWISQVENNLRQLRSDLEASELS